MSRQFFFFFLLYLSFRLFWIFFLRFPTRSTDIFHHATMYYMYTHMLQSCFSTFLLYRLRKKKKDFQHYDHSKEGYTYRYLYFIRTFYIALMIVDVQVKSSLNCPTFMSTIKKQNICVYICIYVLYIK